MEITTRIIQTRIDIIAIKGRLEAFTVKGLREQQEQLLNDDGKNFVVDLSDAEFMDSAGMSALVSLLKRARQVGGDVILVKPTEAAAYRILTLTRFDQVFKIVDSVDDAVQQF